MESSESSETNITFVISVPAYYPEIVRLLSTQDWIVHNFQIQSEAQIYDAASYIQNITLNNFSYRAALDLNVFQFVVNAARKSNQSEVNRAAIALLVFCRISDILIDPTLAIYEKIKYDRSRLEEALDYLQLFRNLDNTDCDALAAYALGYSSSLNIDIDLPLDREKHREELMRYRRLTDWDSMYVAILAIVSIKFDDEVPGDRKLFVFIEWLVSEFRLSLPAVAFAARLFGKLPVGGMMKYRPGDRPEKRRSAVVNMTWDLFIMNHFFKEWTAKAEGQETIFVSDDRAFKSVLRDAIAAQNSGDMEVLRKDLSQQKWDPVKRLLLGYQYRTERVFGSAGWTREYRAKLIQNFEERLFTTR